MNTLTHTGALPQQQNGISYYALPVDWVSWKLGSPDNTGHQGLYIS
jgi:hypothetical protein